MAIVFITASRNSFVCGVFVLPFDNSTCPTTHTRLWYHRGAFHTRLLI
mgnify:CR=1 FL=1